MNKLRLEIGDLRVESFRTDVAEGSPRGTVRAHVGGSDGSDPISVHVTYVSCVEETCEGGSEAGTCDGYSCWGPDCTLWIGCYDEA